MNRILEPELILDEELIKIYDEVDMTDITLSIADLIEKNGIKKSGKLLDIGCGTAALSIELAKRLDNIQILAVDGSSSMVGLAKQNVDKNNLTGNIEVKTDTLPNLKRPKQRSYDIILSKHLLHHLKDPSHLWSDIVKLSKSSTKIYVVDLIRPSSTYEAKLIIEQVCPNAPKIFKTDFLNSLLAAFTFKEVEEQIRSVGLNYDLQIIQGIHFMATCIIP
jgi:2-polyprenyl-3-methyl-5-hydroxy-6-metoxy-1,4-benzoquinol methylase